MGEKRLNEWGGLLVPEITNEELIAELRAAERRSAAFERHIGAEALAASVE